MCLTTILIITTFEKVLIRIAECHVVRFSHLQGREGIVLLIESCISSAFVKVAYANLEA